ncbi:MAG: DUF4870 domain-containing protein [Mojavia pulchra JT2-VF2]|jgi:uncharacterized Tic20 family protein|uniref:DUF4870 domain-containing protein n=1 Tax=Mojavia pulchra JT2-VF2 TaxID=287848 RepID=A0A951Q649_9NOST|nr:DUF4870 domain-containing protein [Mojavia pulchra JT2-VF2]
MKQKPEQRMRIWAMLCHFSALLAWILLFSLIFIGIPLYLPINILVPLIVWRFNKAKSPWIDFQGKESLNFQITLTFYILFVVIISLLLMLIIFGIAIVTHSSGKEVKIVLDALVFMWLSLTLSMLAFQLALVSFASAKAYKGEHYRYPWTIRFLR